MPARCYYDTIPVSYMKDAVERYIEQGIPPGSFMAAVICNDLSEAVGRADGINLAHLADWVRWFYNEAPASCWGSPEKMRSWMDARQAEREESLSKKESTDASKTN